jgi:hypothetical protein
MSGRPVRLVSRERVFFSDDEKAFHTFCSKREWSPRVVAWAKGQYKTYSDYKARYRSELTFDDWLKVNANELRKEGKP